MTNKLSEESRPNTFPLMPLVAVAPSSRVIHTSGVPAVSFTPFLISRLDSRTPYVSFCLLPRSTVIPLAVLRRIYALVDGATYARRHARQLVYIVSARDGPGSLSGGVTP